MDLLWILAVKDDRVVEHYQKYYTKNHVPTIYELYFITNDIMVKTEQVTRAFVHFQYSAFLTMARIEGKTFTFPEIGYEMFRTWCFYLTRCDIKKLTDEDFIEIFREERLKYGVME